MSRSRENDEFKKALSDFRCDCDGDGAHTPWVFKPAKNSRGVADTKSQTGPVGIGQFRLRSLDLVSHAKRAKLLMLVL